ncbi:MAG: hypothetical protein PHW83_01505 [Bacteroidales bacterium]|nr:hypothetical protein [Bacteroidales bacterium]
MYFNYKNFIEELKNSSLQKDQQTYKTWLKNKGKTDYTKEKFYKYIKQIKPIDFRIPRIFQNNFDYDLLLALVVLSFSSSYKLIFPDPSISNSKEEGNIDLMLPDLIIYVKSGSAKVNKSISSLCSTQIYRLYEIYFNEMILLWDLRQADSGKNSYVDMLYMKKINEYNEITKTVYNYIERSKCLNY